MDSWAKKIIWFFLGIVMTLRVDAEPVEVVVTGVKNREGAYRILKRLPEELGERIQSVPLRIKEAEGMWLVRLGPMERSMMIQQKLIEGLGEAGYHPMVLPAVGLVDRPKRDGPLRHTSYSSTSQWQWALWAFLGGGLLLFLWRRGRHTRSLTKSQDQLEARQKRLEEAIDHEGGGEYAHSS